MQSNFCLQITPVKSGFCGIVFHLLCRHNQEWPPKKDRYEYLVFIYSHFSSAVLCQLLDQMMSITYSLFTLMNYQLIFINIQLIYNSDKKQKAAFGANAFANIYWLLFIDALWTSPLIWFIYLRMFNHSGERKDWYKMSESQGFAHRCLWSLAGHAIVMWYIAAVGHVANEILFLYAG